MKPVIRRSLIIGAVLGGVFAIILVLFLRQTEQYVVLVSADGFRWDYGTMYGTPSLDAIAEDGVRADRLVPAFPSKTFPNHYTLATGLYPDNHGIVNNTFYAPDLGKLYRIGDRTAVEDQRFYSGEPVWSTASNQGLVTASFYWVGSEAPVGGNQPDYWKVFDSSVEFEARIDTVIKWLSYPEKKRPRLVTLYFEEPDGVAHDFGPVSEETGRAVRNIDSLMGVLDSKIRNLKIGKRVNLIFLSDHGMTNQGKGSYLNLLDHIPAYMINRIDGSSPIFQIDPKQGFADSIVSILEPFDSLRVWKKEDLPPEFNYGKSSRIPEIIILADSGRVIGTRPGRSEYAGGDHGYDPSMDDMQSLLVARGPGFRKGQKVEQLQNTDIYNMVCRLLHIEPSENDGSMERIEPLLK